MLSMGSDGGMGENCEGVQWLHQFAERHQWEDATQSGKASGIDEEVTELTAVLDAAVELDDSLQKAVEEIDKKKQTQVNFFPA